MHVANSPNPWLLGWRLLVLVAAAFSFSGCGADATEAQSCSEPRYDGAATDEAFRALDDEEPKIPGRPALAPEITRPTEGQEIAATDFAPRIEWTSALGQTALTKPRQRRGTTRTVEMASGSLFFSRAQAHGLKVNGPFFRLKITIPGQACPVTVATTETYWQMDGASWTLIRKAVGQTISLAISGAYLTDDEVTEGPYLSAKPRSFRIVEADP